MTEIPDDVMKAAYDAALDYRNDKACDPIHNDDALQIAFARAILAERERCAKIADRTMYGATAADIIRNAK